MSKKPRRILGIDPGTREIGVAVLCGDDLEYYGVKNVRRRDSPSVILDQIRAIIYELLKRHRPHIIALEKPFLGYGSRSTLLVVVAREIRETGRKANLDVVELSPAQVKKSITGNGRSTKLQMAERLCERFPELKKFVNSAWRPARQKYWLNMFDAVAVGLTLSDDKPVELLSGR